MNATTTHPDAALLRAYLDDQLVGEQVEKVVDHLNLCDSCQIHMDEISNASAGKVVETLRGIETVKDQETEVSECTDVETKPTPDGNQETAIFHNGKQYLLLEEVARGGMGIVYRSYDPELDREIAIKIMNPSLKICGEDLIRFKREGRLAGQLQHPGIVPIHDFGCLIDGRMFIAMKLVEGTTFRELIDQSLSRPHQTSQLVDVFYQISCTMAYAHSKDIIHRDLKPENVMVGPFGEVQVMDWGLAKAINSSTSEPVRQLKANNGLEPDSHNDPSQATREIRQDSNAASATKSGTVFGTPSYMSPEQASGTFTDKRADVFALGAILTEILTGAAPYNEGSATVRLGKAVSSDLQQAFRRLDDCCHDDELIQLAKSCMSPAAMNRPADAGVVQESLENYLHRRDEKLREAAFANARHEAQFASEKKRRKQVAVLISILVATFAVSAAGGMLYLNERNVRDRQSAAQRRDLESKVRETIRSAHRSYDSAFDVPVARRGEIWRHAMLQINRAEALIENSTDFYLQSEIDATKNRIKHRLASAAAKAEQRNRDARMKLAIEAAIRRAQYPNLQLQLNRDPELVEDIAEAFEVFGIAAESEIELAAEAIRSSSIRTKLIRGLRLWRAHIAGKSRKLRDPVLRGWIDKLIFEVDPDPYRQMIRGIERDGDRVRAANLLDDPRALNSLLSVHFTIDCLRNLELDDQALTFLEIARRHYPHDFEIHWRLAIAYRKGPYQDLESALECFFICLSLQPDNPGVLVDLGATLFLLQDYPRAIEYSKFMLEVAPEYPQAYVTIAISLAQMGRPLEALDYCHKAIDQRPDFPMAQFNRSLIAGQLKLVDEQLEAIDLAVKGQPNVKHFLQRAKIYRENDRIEEAIESLRPAFKKHGNNRRILIRYGDLNASVGRLETALHHYIKADQLYPFDTVIQSRVSRTLLDLGQPDEAAWWIRCFIACGQIGRDHELVLRCNLVEALARQGLMKEATAQWERLIIAVESEEIPQRMSRCLQEFPELMR